MDRQRRRWHAYFDPHSLDSWIRVTTSLAIVGLGVAGVGVVVRLHWLSIAGLLLSAPLALIALIVVLVVIPIVIIANRRRRNRPK